MATPKSARVYLLAFAGALSCCLAAGAQSPPPQFPFAGSRWIAAGPESATFDTTYAAPYFRRGFTVRDGLTRATAHVTAGGYFTLFANGEKVGDRVLDPAVTRYDKTVKYVTFDLTDRLAPGENALGAVLANGFYNVDTESAWDFDEAPWRDRPALRLALTLEYADGRTEVVGTDPAWRHATGPITFDQLRNGEHYDARLGLGDWSAPGYAADAWAPAVAVAGPAGRLAPQLMPGIKKTQVLAPAAITEPHPGVYVVDFGQNIAGWAGITVEEAPGTEVEMVYGERVHPDGTVDIGELSRFIRSGETQTTRYTAAGGGREYYEPSSTYFGFQYVQIEGLSRAPTPESIRAFVVHTALDTVGHFETSHPLVNRLHDMIQWSYLGNFHSFPEDCPHREKMGWTGDAQLVIETGLFNYDVQESFRKWLGDFRDEQPASGALPGIVPTSGWGYGIRYLGKPYHGPQWTGASIAVPWQVYRWRGDTAILRDNYGLMRDHLRFLDGVAEGHLLTTGIDDHKSIETHTPGAYLSSAYYHHFLTVVADIADVLGRGAEAEGFRQNARAVHDAFQAEYLRDDGAVYGEGGQTQLAVALGCGLVPPERRAATLDSLLAAIERADYHFDAGVLGVKKVIEVLLDEGREDVLYRMATQTDFPSFGHWVELGANTMWQNWDGSQSRNHIMFGSIGDFFYQGLAGIRPVTEAPGFARVRLRPYFPDDMDHLSASHRTPRGLLATDWRRTSAGVDYGVTVPPGSTATLELPVDYRLAGGGSRGVGRDGAIELGAGTHRFQLERR